jgi:hypothetical protein
MPKAALNRKKTLFTIKLNVNLRNKEVNFNIWSLEPYRDETWTLQKIDQKYLQRFETWCWRRTEKNIWTDRVRNEEVLRRVKEERNVTRTVKGRKVNLIGHILHRNWLLKHFIEGKTGLIEVTGRQWRIH